MEENLKNLGGGSGGDDDDSDDRGHQVIQADGTYEVRANQLSLFSWKNIPPSSDNESRITLAAIGGLAGEFNDDGTIDIRGCKGVRITSGPFTMTPLMNPLMSTSSTDGIEIEAGESQSITMRRGMMANDPLAQYISITSSGITIDAGGVGTLTLCAGQSSITIAPEGITIVGLPIVQINPGPPAPPPPPLPMDEPDLPDPSTEVA
jgi:hypothetical protein